jgi:hypothetical protein
MTASTDLDRGADRELARRLTDLLEEGPTRAPERATDEALAHARAHPRRPDPLRALRRDPMGTPWFGSTGTFRPALLVAALGLLLVAGFAAATVGGWFDRAPSVVVPSPSVEPSSSPRLPAQTIRVDLEEVVGANAEIEVTDESSLLVEAVSGTPADGGSVEAGLVDVRNDPDDPARLILTWTGTPCDELHQLVIEADGRTFNMFRPACEGDAIPRDLVLELTFREAIPAAEVRATLETGE